MYFWTNHISPQFALPGIAMVVFPFHDYFRIKAFADHVPFGFDVFEIVDPERLQRFPAHMLNPTQQVYFSMRQPCVTSVWFQSSLWRSEGFFQHVHSAFVLCVCFLISLALCDHVLSAPPESGLKRSVAGGPQQRAAAHRLQG